MPDAALILDRLARTATSLTAVALAWHAAIALTLALLAAGVFRPSRRLAASLLTLPLLSVSVVSFRMDDGFNGNVFLILAALSALCALRMSSEPAARAAPWATVLASAVLLYGSLYPHFLPADAAWWQAAWLAPVGVLPCPTLSIIVGFTLLGRGLGSRTWSSLVSVSSLLYGAFGVLWLGVWLDVGLLAGALLALYLAVTLESARPATTKSSDTDDEAGRIRAFLASKRIALVGVSTHPEHFSRAVMRALVDAGLDVVPVHPSADVIEGGRVYARIADIVPPVRAALIMTPAAASAAVVEECARAGVEQVWLHRGVGTGAVSEAALASARHHRLSTVAGRCPLMFLGEHPAGVHRAHAALLRAVGRYPKGAGRREKRLLPFVQ